MRNNNVLPNNHFRKHWQRYVRTWFDQPGKKKSRRMARAKKAAMLAPRPVDGLLRPAVRGQTVRYNMKLRAGRGFTHEELKTAGIRRKEAMSMGIAVDHRRRNRCEESLEMNVGRLEEYKSRLILFPIAKKRKGQRVKVPELPRDLHTTGPIIPVVQERSTELYMSLDGDATSAFKALKKARKDQKMVGVLAKRAAEASKAA